LLERTFPTLRSVKESNLVRAGDVSPNSPPGPGVGAILYMDKNQATFVWKNVAVVAWRGVCDAPAIRRIEHAASMALDAFPRRAVLIGVVEPGGVAPSEEMRVLSAATNDRLAQRGVIGFAGVFSQSGFFGSVVRGVVTGLTLLSRYSYPFKVFAGHRDAIVWLAELLAEKGQRMSVEECATAVGEFRRHYEDVWNSQFKD
jgi:hypothetical protein